MAVAIKGSYQVDGILNEGLHFAASYLEKVLNRSIFITDQNGLIHYPNSDQLFVQYENIVISIPFHLINADYYFDKADSTLYYPVIHNNIIIAYVIIKNLSANMIQKAIDILAEANLTIKYYFSSLKKTQQNTLKIQNQLIDYLFYPDGQDINDIIKQSGKSFNTELPFLVAVIEVGNIIKEDNQRKLYTCSNEFLLRNITDSFQLAFSDFLILIIADHTQTNGHDSSLNHSLLLRHKEALDNIFKTSFSQGIGTSYPLSHIKKSFHEAMIAYILPSLMGQEHYSQHFSQLGVFTHIFKQDLKLLNDYCLTTLGPLIDYDKTNNSCLLDTLRQLLDHSFSYKKVAQNLYIHINTLYYRINKIQELLGMDISLMPNRVDLYICVKVLDTIALLHHY